MMYTTHDYIGKVISKWKLVKSLRSRKFYIAVTIMIMKYKMYIFDHRTGALHKTIFKGMAEILAA